MSLTPKRSQVLTNLIYSTRWDDVEFIADDLLMRVPVKEVSGTYYIYNRGYMKPVKDKVSPDGEPTVVGQKDDYSEGTFKIEEHALRDRIPVKGVDIFNLSVKKKAKKKAVALTKIIRLNKEITVQSMLHSISNTKAVSTAWNAANPTIEKDIENAITEFRKNAGVSPNTIVIPLSVWKIMKMDPTLRSTWTLVPNRKQQDIELSHLLGYLFTEIKRIFVPFCKYSASKRGGSNLGTELWPEDEVYLLYIGGESKGKRRMGDETDFTWASIYVKEDENVFEWDSPDARNHWVEVSTSYDIKEACSNAGLRITGVTT